MRKMLFAVAGARPEDSGEVPNRTGKIRKSRLCHLDHRRHGHDLNVVRARQRYGTESHPSVAGSPRVGAHNFLGSTVGSLLSMPASGARRLRMALPRLVLALLLGTLISSPIVLRIFQSEINAQITVIKQQRANAFLAQQQNSQVGAQVTYWRKDVANLEKVIDSGGEVALDPSTDPEVKSLTKQHTAELALEQQYYKQWQCQLYGGSGCPKGNGPLAQASEHSYHQAQVQVNTLNNEIQQRENQLSATDTASKQVRLQQATNALPQAKQQLQAATVRQDQLQANFDAQNEAVNGLLIRLEALNQLSDKNFTVNSVRFLLFLLFLTIECLPVSVKLMQQPGNYEKILQAAAERELGDARKAYRNKPKTASAPIQDVDPNTNLHDIWHQSGRTPSYARVTVTGPQPHGGPYSNGDETGEMSRLDDSALREMGDKREMDEMDIPASTQVDRRARGNHVMPYRTDDL